MTAALSSPRVSTRRRVGFTAAAGITAALLFGPLPYARAQTFFWTGNGANGNLSTAANWAGNVAPPSSVTTSLVFGASRNNSPNHDLGSGFTLASIIFNASQSTYLLASAGGFSFNLAGVGGSVITQNAATVNSITTALTLSTALTINGSGTGNLNLSGIISGNNGITIDQTGQLAQSVGSGFNEGGPLLGGSQITLSSANTFVGDVTLKNGNLVLSNTTALGAAANRLLIQAGTSSLRSTGTVANNIVVDPGAFLTYTGGTGTLSGVISGAGGLQVFGQTNPATSAALTLTNAETYTGATTVAFGTLSSATTVNLTLSGAGTLLGTSQINLLNNGTLTLTNATATNLGNRISDTAALFLTGGRISYTGVGTTAASAETFGAVTLNGGYSVLTLTNTNNKLTFAKLNTPVDKGTLFVRGAIGGTPGTGTSNVVFTDASGLTPVFVPGTSGTGIFGGIIPFIGATTSAGSSDANTFATYDANGLRVLNATSVTDFAQVSGTTLTDDANNNITGGAITVTGNKRINSLAINTTTTFSGAGTLQVYSGAIANFNTTTFNGPALDFGANTGYFHLGFPISFTSTSQITGSGGVVVSSLATGSSYTVTFNNSRPAGQTGAINPFTGGLFINGNATVLFNSDSQLGAAGGGITLNGGTLSYTNVLGATLDSTRPIKIGTVAGSPGTINVGTGTTLTIPSTITGAGDIIKTGTGTLALTGTNTNTGTLNAAAGVVQFNSATALPTGGIIGEGATLQPLQSITLTAPITLTSAPGSTSVGTTTFNINTGQTLTLAGPLKGSAATAALNKTGGGTLDIATNAEYGGSATVASGTLNVGTGSLRNALSVGTSGGTLKLDYAAAGATTDKLGDQTGVILNGGEVLLAGAANTQTVENFGLLTAGAGGNSIFTLLPGTNGSLIATATLGYTGTGSVLFRGTNLGSTSGSYSQLFLTGQASGFITGATADNSATGGGLTQAFYDTAVGVRVALDTDYSQFAVIQDIPNAGPVPITANVLVGDTFANVTTGGSINPYNTINSLSFKNNGTLTMAAGTPTLFLQSGGIFLQEGANATITSGTIGGGTNALSNKTVAVSGNGNLNLASNLQTTGGLQKSGSGTLTLTNAKTFTGGTTLSGGTLSFGSDNALLGTGAVTTAAGTTLNLNNTNQSIGSFNSAGNVILSAGKTLTLTGTSNTISGLISGGGGIAFNPTSTATLTLNTANTYSGGTTTGPLGIYALNNASGFGTGPVTFSNTSGTASISFATGTATVANDFNLSTVITTPVPGTTFTNGTVGNQTVTLSGKISGGTAAKFVSFDGPGANTSGFNLTNINNDFVGTVEIFQGNLGITDNRVLGNAANSISLNASGTIVSGLILNAQNINIARNIVATSSSGINTNGNNGTISGILSGTAALTKQGAGTLTLSNTANTYSGTFNVASGTLNLTGNLSTTATVNVAAGTTLSGNNTGVGGGGKVVVAGSGIVAPGDGGAAGVFGTLNLQTLQVGSGSILRYDIDLSSTLSDQILITQVFNKTTSSDKFVLDLNLVGTINGAKTYTLVTFDNTSGPTNPVAISDITLTGLNGYSSQLAFDASARNLLLTLSGSAAATPEPSSFTFLILVLPAAGGVWAGRVRRQTRRKRA